MVEPNDGMRCVDLGCGTGDLTKELHLRLLASSTLGVDRSEAMLEKARTFIAPGLSFRQGDIDTFEDIIHYDLIFSNAALHWVPGHEALFERFARLLNKGGQIAIQVPFNHDHPSQAVAFELQKEAPFKGVGSRIFENVLPLERYASLLDSLGFERVNVRMQVYLHHLPSREDVVEWVKGTFLLDFEKAMTVELYDAFFDEYRNRLMERLADTHPHLLTFKRILMHGIKA